MWFVSVRLCLPPWSLQESCFWPDTLAGFAGLSPRSPGSAALLSPAAVPASAVRGRLLPAVAAHATLRSAQHNPTQTAVSTNETKIREKSNSLSYFRDYRHFERHVT